MILNNDILMTWFIQIPSSVIPLPRIFLVTISKDGNSKPMSALLASEVERVWAEMGRNDLVERSII